MIDGQNVTRWNVSPPSEYVDYRPQTIKSGGDPLIYAKPRIVVRQIGKFPEGAICPDGVLTLNTLYNLYLTENAPDIRFVLGVINSAVTRFYWLNRFFDNKETFPKIKKKPLESIPIPTADRPEQEAIQEFVDRCLAAHGENGEAWESEINDRVYRLYGLTKNEIRLVEESGK